MSRILIIDDDPTILLTLRQVLKRAGHEVRTSSNPLEGLQLARRLQPEIITIDVVMPVMDGWDLLARLRGDASTCAIPVLMLTSLDDVENRIRGLRSGADDYLGKPFAPDELLARIEAVAARRRRFVHRLQTPPPDLALCELENRLHQGQSVDGLYLGRYRTCERIGTGAMGHVFRGWDPKLHRDLALKTIRFDDHAENRVERAERLRREGVSTALFNHPNIVTVYDSGGDGAAAFLAMELVEGQSLAQYLATTEIEPMQVVPLAAAVARGLAAAHDRSILHRDIKPGNVLLGSDGAIKVTDFGIAESLSDRSPGKISGTPRYLAPECFLGQSATERSDLFSFGVLLYECLTGRHPFLPPEGENHPLRVMRATLTHEPTPLQDMDPRIPPRVAEIVHRLLEKAVDRRPQDALLIADHFDELVEEHGVRWLYQPSEPNWSDESEIWGTGSTAQIQPVLIQAVS